MNSISLSRQKTTGKTIHERMAKIHTAKNSVFSLYVNEELNSRIEFTKQETVVYQNLVSVILSPDMSDNFFSELLLDFRGLSKLIGFKSVVVIGDMLTAHIQLAKENQEIILAYARDYNGNTLHLCYTVS